MGTAPRVPRSIVSAIDRYHRSFRHPALRKLEVGGVYALFPKEASAKGAKWKWPDAWPLANGPGVYLVFDRHMHLLYVGTAWELDSRVWSYFKYGPNYSCAIKHSWTRRPSFLAIVPVDRDKRFEAAGLEHFLIETLRPVDNTRGVSLQSNNALLADASRPQLRRVPRAAKRER